MDQVMGSAQNEQPGCQSPQNPTGVLGQPHPHTHSWGKHIWTEGAAGKWYLASSGSQISLGSIWTSAALQEQQQWRLH